ncbi:MAG: serine hydrolase domain-containing protein [Cyanobacteria bacterium J06555_13]
MESRYAQKLQQQLETSFLFTPFLGVNVTVQDEHLGVWHSACGYTDPQTKSALSPNALFYTYSITKTFVSTIILKLVESGVLSLDGALQKYLPTLNIASTITLRQVLNHTSGLPSYTALPEYSPSVAASPGEPWPETRVLDLLQTDALDFEPGTQWRYSNTGYFALKKVIERELPFAEALERYITVPLGLKNTFVADRIPVAAKGENGNKDNTLSLTPGYGRELHPQNRMENIIYKYHPGWCYTGLIASTTEQTVLFYQALFGGDLLPPALMEQLQEPVSTGYKDPRFGEPCYGLGVMIDRDSKYGTTLFHGGQGPGFRPWVIHVPDFEGRAVTIAIFANVSSDSIPLLLADDLLGQLRLS